MDYLEKIAAAVRQDIRQGYYEWEAGPYQGVIPSLVEALATPPKRAVIAEIKPAAPSKGSFLDWDVDVVSLGRSLLKNGAVGLSVLTTRQDFNGSMEHLAAVARLGAPTLMKDFILSRSQIEAGAKAGASTILLIMTLFQRGSPESDINQLTQEAHGRGMEVLVEVHTVDEYRAAVETKADCIGINNRDLSTLELDAGTTQDLLSEIEYDRPIISMSGISTYDEVTALLQAGCAGVLVGSALMKAPDPGAKLRSLVSPSGEEIGDEQW